MEVHDDAATGIRAVVSFLFRRGRLGRLPLDVQRDLLAALLVFLLFATDAIDDVGVEHVGLLRLRLLEL